MGRSPTHDPTGNAPRDSGAAAGPGSFYGAGAGPANTTPRWPSEDRANAPAPLMAGPAQGSATNPIHAPGRAGESQAQLVTNDTLRPSERGRERAIDLARQARAALVRGELGPAEQLALQAMSLAPKAPMDRPTTGRA